MVVTCELGNDGDGGQKRKSGVKDISSPVTNLGKLKELLTKLLQI